MDSMGLCPRFSHDIYIYISIWCIMHIARSSLHLDLHLMLMPRHDIEAGEGHIQTRAQCVAYVHCHEKRLDDPHAVWQVMSSPDRIRKQPIIMKIIRIRLFYPEHTVRFLVTYVMQVSLCSVLFSQPSRVPSCRRRRSRAGPRASRHRFRKVETTQWTMYPMKINKSNVITIMMMMKREKNIKIEWRWRMVRRHHPPRRTALDVCESLTIADGTTFTCFYFSLTSLGIVSRCPLRQWIPFTSMDSRHDWRPRAVWWSTSWKSCFDLRLSVAFFFARRRTSATS